MGNCQLCHCLNCHSLTAQGGGRGTQLLHQQKTPPFILFMQIFNSTLPTILSRFLFATRIEWPGFTNLTPWNEMEMFPLIYWGWPAVHYLSEIFLWDVLWVGSRHNSCSSVLQSFRLFNKSFSSPLWNISKIYDWDGQERADMRSEQTKGLFKERVNTEPAKAWIEGVVTKRTATLIGQK